MVAGLFMEGTHFFFSIDFYKTNEVSGINLRPYRVKNCYGKISMKTFRDIWAKKR
jgi:hypothetical protein